MVLAPGPAIWDSKDKDLHFSAISPASPISTNKTHFSLIFIGLLLTAIFVLNSNGQTYAGQATAIKATVTAVSSPVVTTAVADTGPLPTAGGNITLASAGATVPGVLTVGSSTVSASGIAGDSQATASVNNLSVSVLGNTITADVVSSHSDCTCPLAAASGTFTVTNLMINGGSVTADGSSNQTISLPGGVGSVVLNERLDTPHSITINGIHVSVTAPDLTTTDVVIAFASSRVDCIGLPGPTIFGGRGTGLRLTQGVVFPGTLLTTLVSDTGFLPTSGGSLSVATNNAGLSPILSSGTATASSSGGVAPSTPTSTQSAAQVQNLGVNLLSGAVTIDADTLTSNSSCVNTAGVISCFGSSSIVNLVVKLSGVPVTVTVTGAPNQIVTIPVPLLGSITLVINEQISSSTKNITVNALHLTTNLTGLVATDLIVASAHSDLIGANVATAANVSISGRVTKAAGSGISRAMISVVDMQGRVRSGITNPFGYYSVSNLPAGASCVVFVTSKGYTFLPKAVNLGDSLTGVNFTPADPGKEILDNPKSLTSQGSPVVKQVGLYSKARQ